MYKLNYNKVDKKMFDISKKEKKYFGHIDITEEEKDEIMTVINNDCYIIVLDDKTWSFLPNFDECKKRCELVEIRDKMLIEQDPYHTEHYQAYLSANKKITVDESYLLELNEYYSRLLELPDNYDICENKELFEVVLVDEYSAVEDSCVYEIVKPSFIK